MPPPKRAIDGTAHQPDRRREGRAAVPSVGGGRRRTGATALLRLWQWLLNRWRRRLGWERMDTRDLPRLMGQDTQKLPELEADVNKE